MLQKRLDIRPRDDQPAHSLISGKFPVSKFWPANSKELDKQNSGHKPTDVGKIRYPTHTRFRKGEESIKELEDKPETQHHNSRYMDKPNIVAQN